MTKPIRPLIVIAILANLLTLLLYNYAISQPGGTGAALAFSVLWMPALWLTTIVVAIVFTVRRAKTLFKTSLLKWTLFTLLFCTPVPFIILFQLTHPTPETFRSSSFVKYSGGKVFKTENWYYTSNNNNYLKMHFVADSISESLSGEQAYRKDSIWVYFSPTGDTIKVEQYKAGKLISSTLKSTN